MEVLSVSLFQTFASIFCKSGRFMKINFVKTTFHYFLVKNLFYPIFEISGVRGIIRPQTCQKRIWIRSFLKIFKIFCRGALKGTPAKILLKKSNFCEKSRIFKFSIIYKFMVLTNILENMRPEKSKFGDL